MIQIETFVFNPFQENTYLIYDETKKCVILDPGCHFAKEKRHLRNFIEEKELIPEYVVQTHAHIDHALGMNFVRDQYKIDAIMHKDDLEILRRTPEFGKMIGLEIEKPRDPEKFIKEGEILQFANSSFQVLHVPGHSPGSIALYNEQAKKVFVGDVLFKRGIGRTDLTGGSYKSLIESIKNKLLTMKDDTMVYSGHGDYTTIGEERADNPVLL